MKELRELFDELSKSTLQIVNWGLVIKGNCVVILVKTGDYRPLQLEMGEYAASTL